MDCGAADPLVRAYVPTDANPSQSKKSQHRFHTYPWNHYFHHLQLPLTAPTTLPPHHLTATKIDIPKILRSSISDLPRTRSNHHHPPTLPTENKPHRRSTTEHATRTHVQGPTFHTYSYLMQRTAQLVADSDPVDPCACAEQRFDTLPTLPTLRTNGRTVDQCICTPHPLSMYLSAYMDACMHEVIDNLLIDKVGSTQSRIWPTSTFHHTWRAWEALQSAMGFVKRTLWRGGLAGLSISNQFERYL